jgi:hypothetical protein
MLLLFGRAGTLGENNDILRVEHAGRAGRAAGDGYWIMMVKQRMTARRCCNTAAARDIHTSSKLNQGPFGGAENIISTPRNHVGLFFSLAIFILGGRGQLQQRGTILPLERARANSKCKHNTRDTF